MENGGGESNFGGGYTSEVWLWDKLRCNLKVQLKSHVGSWAYKSGDVGYLGWRYTLVNYHKDGIEGHGTWCGNLFAFWLKKN